jgi:hypothetical protein
VLDLRPAEIGILVPLVGLVLFLSIWPAAITDHSFGDGSRQIPGLFSLR